MSVPIGRSSRPTGRAVSPWPTSLDVMTSPVCLCVPLARAPACKRGGECGAPAAVSARLPRADAGVGGTSAAPSMEFVLRGDRRVRLGTGFDLRSVARLVELLEGLVCRRSPLRFASTSRWTWPTVGFACENRLTGQSGEARPAAFKSGTRPQGFPGAASGGSPSSCTLRSCTWRWGSSRCKPTRTRVQQRAARAGSPRPLETKLCDHAIAACDGCTNLTERGASRWQVPPESLRRSDPTRPDT